MNQGRSLETSEQIGAATAAPREMLDFEDFFAAFRAQLRFALDRVSARLARVAGLG